MGENLRALPCILPDWRFIVTFSVIFLIVTFVVTLGWPRSSLPKVEGEIVTDGITAPITFARDSHGVPHITAKNTDALAFGLGFTHAQDRLWQMEMNRRTGAGRLAEVLGQVGVEADRLFPTFNFAAKAQTA